MPVSLLEPIVYFGDLIFELAIYFLPWYTPKVTLIDTDGIHLKLFFGPRLIRWASVFQIESCPGSRPTHCKVVVSIRNAEPETFRYMGAEAALRKELENAMPKSIEFVPYKDKNVIASQ